MASSNKRKYDVAIGNRPFAGLRPKTEQSGLNLPKTFPQMTSLRLFDASQRGDMYHIRAWLVLQRELFNQGSLDRNDEYVLSLPTVVFNATNKCRDATDYIIELFPKEVPLFVCPWTWSQLKDSRGAPADDLTRLNDAVVCQSDIEYRNDLQVMRSPSDSTNYLKHSWRDFSKLPPKMVLTSTMNTTEQQRKAIGADFDKIFPPLPNSGEIAKPVAIILWRNTGADGGPYPELNTGLQSLAQIAGILHDIGIVSAVIDVTNDSDREKIRAIKPAIHCSDKAYFKVDSLKADYWKQPQPHSGRDVEAYFIQQAFTSKRFHCAIGMRSGALDLMTFLGVPTVSIGLDGLMGEARMNKLAGNAVYKRVNVEYSNPRHTGTGWALDRYNERGTGVIMKSPLKSADREPAYAYEGGAYRPTDIQATESEKIPPGPFEAFDLRLVELGIRVMASTLLEPPVPQWPEVAFIDAKYDDSVRIVKADHARFAFFGSKTKNDKVIKEALEKIQAAENDQFRTREIKLHTLRESRNIFDADRQRSIDAWTQCLNWDSPLD